MEFQTNRIPLDDLYSGSLFPELFTRKEFTDNIGRIPYPRCGRPLGRYIWPYNLPMQVPPDFETNSEQITDLAKRSPFLLLTHPFAKRVLDEIQGLGSSVSASLVDGYLYRARPKDKVPSFSKEWFGPPDPAHTKEGRYNHAGKPVLYVGSDRRTCFLETGSPRAACLLPKLLLSRK